jgi:hypothetical protein
MHYLRARDEQTLGAMPSCAKDDPFASKSILSSIRHRSGITGIKSSPIYLPHLSDQV